MTVLPELFIRRCKERKFRSKVADSTGVDLTGAGLLARTLILRRVLLRSVLDPREEQVGLLLPPSAGAVVANMALTLARRTTVNLNYTLTSDLLNDAITRCDIRHVLTSRRVMERLDLEINTELIYLEDFANRVTLRDKLIAALQAYLLPAPLLARALGLRRWRNNDVLTLIFTAGSTGRPKGVMLTHENIASNIKAIEQVFHLTRKDVLVGILPFFHAFGYTGTFWTAMAFNVKGIYHVNPLDAREVGRLSRAHGGTILLATPTFLRSYAARCAPDDFATLDAVVAGAEQLPSDLADAFERKFGVRPVEGYGATELSPLVATNLPPSRALAAGRRSAKEGTVGRPVPGVAAKVVDLETGRDLDVGAPGMLLVKGPNVMKGYFAEAELTRQVMNNGWYVTGDVAVIDQDGFIQLTGRESRISKIGGEMVPHIRVEEALAGIIGTHQDGGLKAAVTALPDPRKGERLVVVHTKLELTPAQLCQALADEGLPTIFIPSPLSFLQVAALPLLGSGKLDLQRIQAVAAEKLGAGP